MENSLIVTEIYKSIQGESSWAGLPCAFIRLTGCPLRCRWCDTAYAFKGGAEMPIAEILEKVRALDVGLVELTGGEPLAQEATKSLIDDLIAQGFKVLIETGGSEPILNLHKNTHIILDIKCPGSGMQLKNNWENLQYLKASDEIKFVIADRFDFEWALRCIEDRRLEQTCNLLFSPAWGLLKPSDLVAWMLENKVNARLNLQLHKFIWNPRQKGV